MRIQIRGDEFSITDTLRTHVERRLGFVLGRFGERVNRANVGFCETTLPNGATEVRCHIHLRLRPTGSVQVEDNGVDPFVVVNGAADRASRSVARVLARERDGTANGSGGALGGGH